MPTLRSSVLIIGHPNPRSVAFGADFARDFEEAHQALSSFRYPVIAMPASGSLALDAKKLLEDVAVNSPLSQQVLVQNDTPSNDLRDLVNTGSVFRILPSFDDPKFELTIQQALEEHSLLQQNAKLLQLVNEQNDRLKRLTADLEERVEARKNSIEDAKTRLIATNDRVEALHRALVAIHRATSIAEMERLINDALSSALGLSWIRILFQSQGRLEATSLARQSALAANVIAIHSAPLMRGRDVQLGHIYFARPADRPFIRDETSFLGQIADAVSLAIDRLGKLEEAETLKHQWEATFDAILEPVSLIAEDFTLVRINRAFAVRSGQEPEKIIGRKCYEALFGREAPCENCALAAKGTVSGTNFRLKPSRPVSGPTAIYDVFSQRIERTVSYKTTGDALFVNMYHDVSEQLRYERQILESAKMAELGTIGSSIAHELNNPLGGMLSFLQLIKMDLKGDEPWFEDIDEMEKGARRCRDIVQNLLGFTRKSSSDSSENVDLREALEQALKITELQTRAMGITLVQNLPSNPVEVHGDFNALAQMLRTCLQNAQEAIAARIRGGDKRPGEIRVNVSTQTNEYEVEITDNGLGFHEELESESGLGGVGSGMNSEIAPSMGIEVAKQIVRDHGGRLEIRSNKPSPDGDKHVGNSAIISVPRPVF